MTVWGHLLTHHRDKQQSESAGPQAAAGCAKRVAASLSAAQQGWRYSSIRHRGGGKEDVFLPHRESNTDGAFARDNPSLPESLSSSQPRVLKSSNSCHRTILLLTLLLTVTLDLLEAFFPRGI